MEALDDSAIYGGSAVIDYINARLNTWARWRLGARGCSRSPYPAYNLPAQSDADDAPPRESFVPVNDLECCDTDRCVVALNPVLRDVVDVFYTLTVPIEQKCRICGCSYMTLYRRLHAAHAEIMGYLNDLSCGIAVPAYATRSKDDSVDRVIQKRYISGMLV